MKTLRPAALAAAALSLAGAGVFVSAQPASAVNMWVKNSTSSVNTISLKDNCIRTTAPKGHTRILSCSGRYVWIPNERRVKNGGVGYWANTCGDNGSAHWKYFPWRGAITFTVSYC